MSYCVYKHTCPNGKVYIGITGHEPLKRWNNGYGYIGNRHFYSAILKYGWDNIIHEILCENINKEDACAKETEYIKLYKSNIPEYGYNNTSGGDGLNGYKHSEQTKAKMSASAAGRALHDATRRKLSDAHKGKIISAEQRKKISDSLKGRKRNAETIKNMSEAQKGHTVSAEARKKIGEANRKRKISKETREKMRQAHIGKKHTEEERKKISETRRRRYDVVI